MPISAVLAAVLLVLLGLTFCLIPVVAHRYGDAAESAAEEEVVRQGFPVEVLAEHQVRFKESGLDALFPFGIAAVLFVTAALDLVGVGAVRVMSWAVAGTDPTDRRRSHHSKSGVRCALHRGSFQKVQ